MIPTGLTTLANSADPAPASPDAKQRLLSYLLPAFSLALGLPSLWLPLGRDHGVVLYIADLMLHGGAPYKDAWEIRPPGLFYIFAAAIAAFGKTAAAARLMDWLWQAATVMALNALGRRVFGRAAGWSAGALYALTYWVGHDFWSLGNGDAWIALPATLTGLALLPYRRGPRWAWDALVGAAIGAVFLLRFTHGLLALPVLAYLFAENAGQRPYGLARRVGRAIAVGAGGAAIVGAFVAHLLAKGAWSDFYYTLFVFAPKYATTTYRGGAGEFARLAGGVLADFTARFAVATIPALGALAWIAARRRTAGALYAALWLPATLVGLAMMAKFYDYHWLPLFAPLALLAGAFVEACLTAARRQPGALGAAGLAVVAVCAGWFFWRFGPGQLADARAALDCAAGRTPRADYLRRFDTLAEGGDFSASANYAAADYLRARTQPGDPVFVWGFEALIYYLADRRAPTRFVSTFPLIVGWGREDWRQELVEALRRSPPAYVVIATHDAMPWVTGEPWDSLTVMRQKFPTLRDLVQANYEVETTIENLLVCRRVAP
jgi:hypothetical protein